MAAINLKLPGLLARGHPPTLSLQGTPKGHVEDGTHLRMWPREKDIEVHGRQNRKPLQAPGIPAEFQLKGGDLVLDDLATHDTKWCKAKRPNISFLCIYAPKYTR